MFSFKVQSHVWVIIVYIMLSMEDTSRTIWSLEAKIARSKQFRLLKNKRLKLTANRYCVRTDFLRNQFSSSSSITASEKNTNIQRTKLKCNENDQPLNTTSSSNLLSATVSPQLDGLCNSNLQGIFQFYLSYIFICSFYNMYTFSINIHSFLFTRSLCQLNNRRRTEAFERYHTV
jgi:hypothetical protein